MTEKKIQLEVTKSGLPCLWEAGGGMTNTGSAIIIAGSNGERLTPTYTKRRGHLACGQHALYIVREQYYIIEANHHRTDFLISIWQISSITKTACAVIHEFEKTCYHCDDRGWVFTAALQLINEFERGEWLEPLPDKLKAAVEAAKGKATCYHCREPHFVR